MAKNNKKQKNPEKLASSHGAGIKTEEQKPEPNVKEIFDLMRYTPNEKDKNQIKKAFEFAKKGHEGQKRLNGDPFFIHVFETAKNLARLGMDTKTIIAGLLHDVIEDTDVTTEELEKNFGKTILFLVEGVTKLGTLKYRGRERHVESLRKFFIAMSEDVRVLIIKLADRLHNMKTLKYLREDKQKRIALETLEIHAPLANRLGMWRLKGELQDYAFPYIFPEEYKQVEELLKQRTSVNLKSLETIYRKLKKEMAERGIKDIKTDYRMKHKYSLWRKLQRKDMNIDNVYDTVALRVIVPTIEDCYSVLGIAHQIWKPVPGRIKDFISFPKPNGYQSLHTTIFTGKGDIAEIQIRTQKMHDEAEYGIASHFAYKEGLPSGHPEKLGKGFEWIGELKELQKAVAEPEKFLEHLKMDFFKDRIFVFTPEGDVVDLPEESSPIDFAYKIHSDIGNHTSGAKVNGKMSSLDTKLQNGDIVEIVTKKDTHPNSKWLNYVKTTMAKRHIQKYVQEHSTFKKLFRR